MSDMGEAVPVIVDVRDYRELYRKTRTVDRDISRELSKRLRKAGKIGADASRAKIREWPAAGGISAKAGGRAHRGLRATISANIRVSAGRRNVLIRSGAQGITGKSAADVPRDIDRGGWYHPVFGHRGTSGATLIRLAWRQRSINAGRGTRSHQHRAASRGLVFQAGWPYFTKEIASKEGEMTAEVAQVLDDVARRL